MSWHCLKVKHAEQAYTNLLNQGYWPYRPMIPCDTRIYRRRFLNREDLFPGYIFVYLEPGIDDFRPVRSTRGVAYMVHFGPEPARLTEAQIETIRQIETRLQPIPEYRRGDQVKVHINTDVADDVAMAEYRLSITKDRALVLMWLLNEWREVEVDRSQLEPIT